MDAKTESITSIRGFTLLELMIVLVIAAIGVAIAVPTYQDVLQRRDTTAQAEELVAFMSFAQGEAVKNNRLISLQLIYTDAKNWCIGATEGNAPCDCTTDPCLLNGVENILRSPNKSRFDMTDPTTDLSYSPVLVFDPVRGMMTEAGLGSNHSVILESDNDKWSLRIDVEVTGRIAICSPDSTKAVPGYKAC